MDRADSSPETVSTYFKDKTPDNIVDLKYTVNSPDPNPTATRKSSRMAVKTADQQGWWIL